MEEPTPASQEVLESSWSLEHILLFTIQIFHLCDKMHKNTTQSKIYLGLQVRSFNSGLIGSIVFEP